MTPARQKRGGRRPRTRRHLAYRSELLAFGRWRSVLVNTGKDYPAHPDYDALGPLHATTNQRDIRGRGRTTSRCKRAFFALTKRITALIGSDSPMARRMNPLSGDA